MHITEMLSLNYIWIDMFLHLIILLGIIDMDHHVASLDQRKRGRVSVERILEKHSTVYTWLVT